jgi:hypothetical protein
MIIFSKSLQVQISSLRCYGTVHFWKCALEDGFQDAGAKIYVNNKAQF